MSHHQPYRKNPRGGTPYRQGGRRTPNSNSNSRPPRNAQKPKPSFWQKILRFFGIGKPKQQAARPAKTNTRFATRPNHAEPRRTLEKPEVTSARVYIGNLSYEALEPDIEDLFRGIGGVRSVEIVYNPRTHRSKGYGFVDMQSVEDARRAVEVLHDQPFMGRKLILSGARPKEESFRREESFAEPVDLNQQ